VSLRLLFLILVRVCSWLVPARPVIGFQERRTVGVRHEVPVVRRATPRPKLDWADRGLRGLGTQFVIYGMAWQMRDGYSIPRSR
jgi:hypothetical protein